MRWPPGVGRLRRTVRLAALTVAALVAAGVAPSEVLAAAPPRPDTLRVAVVTGPPVLEHAAAGRTTDQAPATGLAAPATTPTGQANAHDPAVACGDVGGLIAAMVSSNASGVPTTIRLAEGCTYELTAAIGGTGDGLPQVTGTMTIDGHGATIRRAPGSLDLRNLDVASSGTLTLRHLAVTGGRSSRGAGILNAGVLTLSDSRVSDNVAVCAPPCSPLGGGILNFGLLKAERSRVSENTATCSASFHLACAALGGGILSASRTAVTLIDSRLSGNRVSCSAPLCEVLGAGAFTVESLQASCSIGGCTVDTMAAGHAPTTLIRTEVEENIAECLTTCAAEGAGLWTNGPLAVRRSVVEDNAVTCSGPSCLVRGGGVIDAGGMTMVTGSRVRENRASCSGSSCAVWGGGLVVLSGTLTMADSSLDGNAVSCPAVACAVYGGGLFADSSTVRLSDAAVRGNAASCSQRCVALGGGVVTSRGSSALTETDIEANSASCTGSPCVSVGGGVLEGGVTAALLAHDRVRANTASCALSGCFAFGGGVFNGSVSISCAASCAVQVLANPGPLRLVHTVVERNAAACSAACSARGGGVWSDGPLVLTRTEVERNAAAQGGGIDVVGGTVMASRSEVSDNRPGNCFPVGSVPACTG